MLSRISLGFCILLMLYASFVFFPRWKQPETQAAIAWDVSGYYWYLPSLIIYKDIKQHSFKDSILHKYKPSGNSDFSQGFLHENGNYILKYSSGMAVMYLPFFLVAHAVAKPLGFPPDGFSAPYQFAVQLGGLLVAVIGLWYLRKLLLRYYSDKVVALCLFLLVFGTNFLNYGAIDTGMSHCWLFTVYVFVLHFTVKFYNKPSYKYAMVLGLLCGLATLTRPTDVISALIPLLWGVRGLGKADIRSHFQFLVRNTRYLLVSAVFAALIFSIQLIYWKYVSGEWIVYSYQDQGFHWLHPRFYDYLFSARNGWLAYAPVLLLSLLGLIPLWRYGKHALAITAFILVDLYIVSSWEFYWYGGRFMVQAYPVLLFPMAAFINWMLLKRFRQVIIVPVLLLFVYVGLWTTVQYHYGNIYDWETNSRKYYWATIGRWDVSQEMHKLKDTNEIYSGELKQQRVVYFNDFESDTTSTCDMPPVSGAKSVCLNENINQLEYVFPYSSRSHKWLRVQATFHCEHKEWNVWEMTQLIVTFLSDGKEVKNKWYRVYRLLNSGETKDLHLDIKVPKDKFDTVKIAFSHFGSKQTLLIDDLKATAFNED